MWNETRRGPGYRAPSALFADKCFAVQARANGDWSADLDEPTMCGKLGAQLTYANERILSDNVIIRNRIYDHIYYPYMHVCTYLCMDRCVCAFALGPENG